MIIIEILIIINFLVAYKITHHLAWVKMGLYVNYLLS